MLTAVICVNSPPLTYSQTASLSTATTQVSLTTPVRASACPGLLRIVPALDGGICRIKLACGQLTAVQADAIVNASMRYGSGIIEITNRANLQIRGIQMPHADALIAMLLDAGLGATTPGGDDVRNLMVSPSAGIDSAAFIDTTPLAKRILSLLQTQTRLHQLSPKFAISIDGGERLAMLEHPHDLWLSAIPANNDEQAVRFAFGLASCPAQSDALAAVLADQVLVLVEAVLHTFLDFATAAQSRMRHLLEVMSAQEFLRRMQLRLPFTLINVAGAAQRRTAQQHMQQHGHIGIHAQYQTSLCYVGAVPPLGRIDATQLRALTQLATQLGDGTLRLTPWQSVLLPNIAHSSAAIVAYELQEIGFSTQVDEPLVNLIACTGSRGCAKGLADTKADALQFAQLLQRKSMYPAVHFSGCSRSCASASIAPFTLLAVADGHYDLYQRDESALGFSSSKDSFGKLIETDIDIYRTLEILENSYA